jgi:hypothetical protein
MITLALTEKSKTPSEFHFPPFSVWFTLTVIVPCACWMVTGTDVARLDHAVHHSSTSYFPELLTVKL